MSFVKVQPCEKLTQLVQQTMTITILSFEGKVEQAQSHCVILMPIPIMTTILSSRATYLLQIVEALALQQLQLKALKMFWCMPVLVTAKL